MFSCKLLLCFSGTLTLEYILSRGSTSLAEQNYIVTIDDSCKECILDRKLEIKYTQWNSRKEKFHSTVLLKKMAAVKYMFCAIFAPNSVGKILQKHLFEVVKFQWNWGSCNFTKDGLYFRAIFLKENSYLYWKLTEQLLLLQSYFLIFRKDIFQNSYYWLLVKLATLGRLMFVEINFRDINFCGIRGFWQYRKKLTARIFF